MGGRNDRPFCCANVLLVIFFAVWYTGGMEKHGIKLRAFGKVNLSLNITGRAADGMHKLDSVMMSVDVFDTVTVTERDDENIVVTFTDANIGADNTAFKAARAVQGIIGGNGWDIVVEKGIPIGAGLGGSSADGAAVLRALDVLYKLPERGVDMRAVALSVGSDVPFMLTGGLARVRGTGDDMFFMENKLTLFAAGIMCGEVSTAAAYKKFDELYGGEYRPTNTDALCEKLLAGDAAKAVRHFGNALYAPATELLGEIVPAAKLLGELGADCVNMTGSGGMVIGYFTDIMRFAECANKLKGRPGFTALAPARTGILHERI